jgi:hypothetical protein
MSFGREDLVLEGTPTSDDVERLLRCLRGYWPRAVAARADQEIVEPLHLHQPGWTVARRWKEFFVCEDLRALRSWSEQGAIAENADTMVHILATRDSLTAVVDDANGPLGRLLRGVLATIERARAVYPQMHRAEAA